MREFDYVASAEKLLTPKIVRMLSKIHEYKGSQNLFIESGADILASLMDVARIQSTDASNRIEGIYTSDSRLRALVQEKVEPRNRNEQEISGYRDVLNTIHESYDSIPIKSGIILQLHRNLYQYSGVSFGGKFKNSDNVIEEVDISGHRTIRFVPVSAFETPEAIQRLCDAYDKAIKNEHTDPLLLIPLFVLDFLCIHPFNDGNGRMSRLLTLLLMYQNDYIVGKYVSLEKSVEKSKEAYYDALQLCSAGWHEAENEIAPFVEYLLGVMLAAYQEFFTRVEYLSIWKITKKERIRLVIQNHLGQITKREIIEQCPDISPTTVEATLAILVKDNLITKVGDRKNTSYYYNHQNDRTTQRF